MSENGKLPGSGYLRVRVTIAGGTLPVKGAQVVISEYERNADPAPEERDRTEEGYPQEESRSEEESRSAEESRSVGNDRSAEDGSRTGAVLFRLTTDSGGLTRTVTLPAPAAGDSLKPGAARPYSLYNVSVSYDGYYPVEGVGVPVFDRIVAVQPVDLTPLSVRNGEGIPSQERNRVMIYETPDSQSLQPGGLRREDIGSRNGTLTDGFDERGVDE